ncbi:hypothetical protein CVT25_007237 [Psilocybe cyanescens]|uniref:Uncharacterized protein n=1 Tax=Psilocybe cyanescens TaxID=93625 RepID=A0A409XVT2_PSICY|nr:hypothetical protein CVT25_007237 [Psilocybe cyanescens]
MMDQLQLFADIVPYIRFDDDVVKRAELYKTQLFSATADALYLRVSYEGTYADNSDLITWHWALNIEQRARETIGIKLFHRPPSYSIFCFRATQTTEPLGAVTVNREQWIFCRFGAGCAGWR